MAPPLADPLTSTREFQILELLVQSQHESRSTVAAVLQQILALTSSALASNDGRQGNMNEHAYRVCIAIVMLVERTPPHRQSNLVNFLVELRQQTLVVGEESLRIWENMPTLGYTLRDAWNFNPNNPAATPDKKLEWEHKTAFVAQLTSRAKIDYSEGAKSVFDFSTYALWAMRAAFEGYERPASETALRAACLWFIYAGEVLCENVEHEVVFPDRVGVSYERFAQKGWRGFERERMEVWKSELVAAGRLQSGETKALIEQALARITGLEAQ
ncbi:hypothetical protein GGR57DRAFT_502818 [Xylariaceae sp. FL1272]|nr:hypothetical protein GGR57DRAFT_502818 [Xylariaceae sp. FL1272]